MKYILNLVILSIFLVGCNSKTNKNIIPPPPTTSIVVGQIITCIVEHNIDTTSFIVPDAKYVLPTRDWIESEFSNGLSSFQSEMGISTWSEESNDCDKFSIATSFYAKWLNHSSPNRNVNASIACGEVFYKKSSVGNHAINFFIIMEKSKLKVIFYEPQTRSIVTLNPEEIRSIFFLKL